MATKIKNSVQESVMPTTDVNESLFDGIVEYILFETATKPLLSRNILKNDEYDDFRINVANDMGLSSLHLIDSENHEYSNLES